MIVRRDDPRQRRRVIKHNGVSPLALGALLVIVLFLKIMSDRWRTPAVPSFEEALADPTVVAAVCKTLGQPAPPELKTLDPEAAKAIFQALMAASAKPQDAALIGRLAMTYHAHDMLGLAEPAYQAAEKLDPADFVWPYYQARIAQSRGESQKAIEAFTRSIKLRPDYTPNHIHLADVYFESNNFDKAEQSYREYAESHTEESLGYSGLGRVANARGDTAKAIEYLEKAVQYSPPDYRAYHTLGGIYREQGKQDKAASLLAAANDMPKQIALKDRLWFEMNSLSTTVAADLDRYESAEQLGNYKYAFTVAQRITRRAPDNIAGWLDLAKSARDLGRLDDAEKAAKKVIELKKDLPDGYTDLAIIYHDQAQKDPRKLEMAKSNADQAIALDPKYPSAWAIRAQIYEDLHQPDEALRCLREAVRLRPGEPVYWKELCRFLRDVKKDYAGAIEAVKKCLEVLPDWPEAREELRRLRILTGQEPPDPPRSGIPSFLGSQPSQPS